MVLSVGEEWRFRMDRKCVVLYELDELGLVSQSWRITPPRAAVLAMFDGTRDTDEILRDVAYVFDLDIESASSLTHENVIEPYKAALVECTGRNEQRPANIPDPSTIVGGYRKEDISVDRVGRLDAPLTINWDITWDCPRRCLYCYSETDRAPSSEVLPLETALRVVDEAATAGVASVLVGGGDPFAYPHIMPVLHRMMSAGISVYVATKSRLSRSTIRDLAEIGLPILQVSLDSFSPATADLLTGSHGYLADAIHNLRLLKEFGIEARVNAVMTPFNLADAPSLITHLVEEHSVRRIAFSPYGRSGYRHSDDLFISPVQHESLRKTVQDARGKYPEATITVGDFVDYYSGTKEERTERFHTRARCTAGRTACTIVPDGRMIPCEQVPTRTETVMGDLRSHSILDIWASPQAERVVFPDREVFRGTVCYQCEEYEHCIWHGSWCMRDAWKGYGRLHGPSPGCPHAPEGHRMM